VKNKQGGLLRVYAKLLSPEAVLLAQNAPQTIRQQGYIHSGR